MECTFTLTHRSRVVERGSVEGEAARVELETFFCDAALAKEDAGCGVPAVNAEALRATRVCAPGLASFQGRADAGPLFERVRAGEVGGASGG